MQEEEQEEQQQPPAPPWQPPDLTVDAFSLVHNGPQTDPAYPMGSSCVREVEVPVVDADTNEESRERVFLVRQDEPVQAYRLVGKISKPLGPGKRILVCVVYNPIQIGADENGDPVYRTNENNERVFLRPRDGEHQNVAVKELETAVLAQRGDENPYRECAAMFFHADNIHLLRCIDVLQDYRYFYIVMPYCHEGDFADLVGQLGRGPAGGMPEAAARRHFRRILRCLAYLQRRRICHRDLSPENIAIRGGECIFIDLGMCIGVPYRRDAQNVIRRTLITPQPYWGKPPYMTPEFYVNREQPQQPVDGYAMDLWAAGTILFYMLTGMNLYDHPDEIEDGRYFWFVVQGALGNIAVNNTVMNLFENEMNLFPWALAIHNMSPEVRNLLHGMLRPNPAERLTLGQVINHDWVNAGP